MKRINAFLPGKTVLVYLGFSTMMLHAELLTKSPYSNRMSKEILFMNATQGKASCNGPGCGCEIGFSYVIEQGDTVRVTKTSKPQDGDHYCPVTLLHKPCKLRISTEDKIFSNQLVCEDEQYTNVKATIAVNTRTELNSVPVIFLGKADGHATEAVKLRAAPDASAEAGACHSDGGMIETIPKKGKVLVVARTVDKAKVGNWQNYWYFVEVVGYECSFEKSQRSLPYRGAWVFGEFIKYKRK